MTVTRDGDMFVAEDGCHYDTIPSLVGISMMGLCGCGYSEAIVEMAHQALRLIAARSTAHRTDDREEAMRLWGKLTELLPDTPLGELLLHVMDNAGWLEHGTSIRGSWLTREGENALALLDLHYVDQRGGPDGNGPE